jgi:hypothetical protein
MTDITKPAVTPDFMIWLIKACEHARFTKGIP